ncbi:MAG: hypothetical protein LGB68_04220, partial [Sulfurovum sp.]|nr:hypothetical protein [Sulfurovum sp.]
MKLFTRIFLPIALFVYITIETYMKLHHTSLCDATGCKLAGELLRFKSIYLNYIGLLGTLLLALFGGLSLRNERFKYYFQTLLFGALAFETTLFSYQVASNPEPCVFCMGVLGSLFIIALLEARHNLLLPISIAGAISISIATLGIFQNQSVLVQKGLYLIYSDTCPHCKKVKKYFAQHHIDYTSLSVVDPSARAVLKYFDIDKIPVLIDKNTHNYNVIVGDSAIIKHFDHENLAHSAVSNTPSKDILTSPSSIPNIFRSNEDEGCSISFDIT